MAPDVQALSWRGCADHSAPEHKPRWNWPGRARPGFCAGPGVGVGITALHDCTLRPSVSSTGRWIYHLTHTLDRIFSLFILADNSWGTGPAGMGVVLLGEKCFLVQ